MPSQRCRAVSSVSLVENLESRCLLSASASAVAKPLEIKPWPPATDATVVRKAATTTTVKATAGTLGQPITFTVTVRAAAAAGAPQGTVALVVQGATIQTLTLATTTSTNARFAESSATYTLTQPPGGSAYYFGAHAVRATFTPSGDFAKSTGAAVFVVKPPTYTKLSDGVKYATITAGSGPAVQTGEQANVLYTGYLTSNGHIFDDSADHGDTTYGFVIGQSSVITGFDEGATGMQAGESRIVYIPPKEGYGSKAVESIPGNSTLIFVITLESIT